MSFLDKLHNNRMLLCVLLHRWDILVYCRFDVNFHFTDLAWVKTIFQKMEILQNGCFFSFFCLLVSWFKLLFEFSLVCVVIAARCCHLTFLMSPNLVAIFSTVQLRLQNDSKSLNLTNQNIRTPDAVAIVNQCWNLVPQLFIVGPVSYQCILRVFR